MKINLKKNFSAILSLLLCMIILLGMIPFASADLVAISPVSTNQADLFDFGVPYAENNITLTAAELFERIFAGEDLVLSDAEEAYLNDHLYTLTYNDTLPSDAVKTYFDKNTGILDVTVPVYVYKAENGEDVSWYPLEATVDGVKKSFSWNGTAYTCQFTDLEDMDEDFDMDVKFIHSVDFSKEVIEAFLLQSRADGMAAQEILAQYEKDYEIYLKKSEAYQAWKTYPEKLAAWTAYQKKLAEYHIQKAEYDAYIEEASTYEARLKAYNDYLDAKKKYNAAWEVYEQYKLLLAQYEKDYDLYLEYCDRVATAKAQLEVLETLFVTDSHGWQLYASVMGPTVSQVLNRKEELSVLNKEAQVTAANDSTEELRILMKGYADLRKASYSSDHEKYKALHNYYSEHYTALRDNFRKLYEALYNLYSEDSIRNYIHNNGKGEHFRQFLGQLYITTCCLDDNEVIKTTWKPVSKWYQTLPELVEECQFLRDDVQADPTGKEFPATEVKEPVKIVEVTPPIPPTVVKEPEVPVPVDQPVEPAEVPHPGAQPPMAEHPGNPPTEPKLSDVLVAWADAYETVDYDKREGLVGERSLKFEATLTRNVSIENQHRVRFYSHDGELIGEVQSFVDGDSVQDIEMPTDPDRASTTQYVYDFIGWKLFDGTELTAELISGDISFRAAYERYLCEYEIKWVIDGQLDKKETYAYGSVPSYPVENRIEGIYNLVFSGWSPAIKPVTENATYEGYFQKVLRTHTVTWVMDNGARIETEEVAEGAVPVYKGVKDYIKDNAWYRFADWDQAIKTLTGDVTYTARYQAAQMISLDENGQSNIEVTVGDGEIVAQMLGTSVDLTNLYEICARYESKLVLKRDDVSLVFDADALQLLRNAKCVTVQFSETEEGPKNGTGYTVVFYNAQEQSIRTDAKIKVHYRYQRNADTTAACYVRSDDTWVAIDSTRQGGVLSAELVGGGTFWVGYEYDVLYDAPGDCNITDLPERSVAGMWIDLGVVKCARGYEVVGAILTLADGTTKEIIGAGFEMPDGAVTVSLLVDRMVYHVSFVVDGKVIAEGDYFLGDEVEAPKNPTLNKGDGLVYTFTGWSPRVALVGGDEREIVYTAQFMSGSMITDEQQKAMESNDVTKRIVLIVVIFVAVVAGIVVAIVFMKKRKMRK